MITKFNQFNNEASVIDRPFYLFGSENSTDYDIIVDVENIPKAMNEAHDICKHYNEKLSELLSDKPMNCNLGTFKNGTLVNCFKGTVDELVNVIYYTYDNHEQFYPNPIDNPGERDINEKVLRVARFLITFYSRGPLRTQIKPALRGDLRQKVEVLKQLNYEEMVDFPRKKELVEDIYKVIAFQFGQVFSPIDGFEADSYTKNGIIKNYPDLSNLLNRKVPQNSDLKVLNKYMNRFTAYIEDNIEDMRLIEVMK